jgi:hypothetical protein
MTISVDRQDRLYATWSDRNGDDPAARAGRSCGRPGLAAYHVLLVRPTVGPRSPTFNLTPRSRLGAMRSGSRGVTWPVTVAGSTQPSTIASTARSSPLQRHHAGDDLEPEVGESAGLVQADHDGVDAEPVPANNPVLPASSATRCGSRSQYNFNQKDVHRRVTRVRSRPAGAPAVPGRGHLLRPDQAPGRAPS